MSDWMGLHADLGGLERFSIRMYNVCAFGNDASLAIARSLTSGCACDGGLCFSRSFLIGKFKVDN